MTISFKGKAVEAFESMMRSGKLDGLIVYDLIEAYKFNMECAEEWELREALRKVLKYYLPESEYEQFKKEVGIES